MTEKTFFRALFLLLFLGLGMPDVRAQVSMDEAVRLTLERNLQIKQAEFGCRISEQNLLESKSALYPNLSVGVSNSHTYGLTFDQISGQVVRANRWTSSSGGQLSSSLAVFQGFQKVNQIRANRIQLLVDATEVDKIKNELTLSVITNYLEAITNGELHEAALAQAELSHEQLRQDSIQFAVGNKTLADLAQSENQVAVDELNIMSAQNAHELSLLALKQLMEMPADAEITLAKPDIADLMGEYAAVSPEEIFGKALSSRPEIEQAAHRKRLAEKNIDMAKGAYYPTVTLNGSYGTNYSSEVFRQQRMTFGEQLDQNKSFRGGISLDYSIFDNHRRKTALNRAKINYLQAENSEALARRNLEKTISQAVLDLKSANKQYLASGVAFNTAKVAFRALKERYDVGMANSIELFTAQTNMNRAEFDMIRRKYELLFRSKVIDFYVGFSN